jgi:hypothetical protein
MPSSSQVPQVNGVMFSATYQPENVGGRTPARHLREMLSKPSDQCPTAVEFRRVCKLTGDVSIRQALDERLLQIAFTDRVIVVGYDKQTESVIERVSSMECIKAIELIKKYDVGLPKKGTPVSVPAGTDKSRSTYDIALETYRDRLLSGELSEDELLAVTKIFAEAEKAEAEMIARILGDKSEQSKALRERVENLLARMEARMNAAEAPKVIDAQVVSDGPKAEGSDNGQVPG